MKFIRFCLYAIAPLLTLNPKCYSSVTAKPGEFIVKIKKNKLFNQKDATQIGKSSFYLLKSREEKSLLSLKSTLESTKDSIEYIEPNYIYHSTATNGVKKIVNDALFNSLWNFQNQIQKNADINVVNVWREGIVGSQKIIVAIIDSGIDYQHPDLQKNLYTNKKEIAGNGFDDDHNGYVDDIHGWNFVNNTPDASDDTGHGTHSAGIIGAEANNHFGIAGINWNVSILPLKFLDQNGDGETQNAILAIEYARAMGARIINASWGGDPYSQALSDAIQEAQKENILFVAAAGNEGVNNDLTPFYPASLQLDNIISVGASDEYDQITPFSNYGAQSVHISAPGNNIYSTYLNSSFEFLNGTSMAAPHVAGVAALLLSREPYLTAPQLKKRLMDTSDPVNAMGRLNAYNAIHNIIPFRGGK